MPVIVPAAAAAIKIGYGVYQDIKGAKEAKALAASRPAYKVSPYAKGEYNLAAAELGNGMGGEAERTYENDLDRTFSSSIDAVERLGGGANSISALYGSSQAGRQRLTMMKEQLRLNNINNYINASRNMQEEADKEFQINQYAPWADKSQANAARRQEGANLIASGLGSAAGAAGTASDTAKLNNYFKWPNTTGSSANTPVLSGGMASNGSDLPVNADNGSAGPAHSQLDLSGTGDDSYFTNIGPL